MENKTQDYQSEILAIIRGNTSPGVMRNKLEDYHENDLADVFSELTAAERRKVCRILNLDMLSDIFEYIDEKQAAEYLDEMDVRKAAGILSGMETDAVVDVLRMTPKEKKVLLIELMDDEARKDMAIIASFDEEEIGSKMTTNCIMIRENLTVKQAMSSLIGQAAKNDNISTIFMVTEDSTFYGALDLKDLIIARQDACLEDLIVTSYPYVYGNELIDDCIEKLKDYSENSIPVLDNDNKLLGVITSQSIVELVDDEMGEDYAMFAGLTAEEDLKEPLRESLKKRLPWLLDSCKSAYDYYVFPVTDPGYGRKCRNTVTGRNNPCSDGRVPDRKTEGRISMEGNDNRIFERSDSGNIVIYCNRTLYCTLQRKDYYVRLCSFRLHRNSTCSCNGYLRSSRNMYSAVL